MNRPDDPADTMNCMKTRLQKNWTSEEKYIRQEEKNKTKNQQLQWDMSNKNTNLNNSRNNTQSTVHAKLL